MASIRNRSGKWQARVTRKGFPDEVKTFGSRIDAERWARSIETEMDRGCFVSRSEAEATTLQDVIERYIVEVCPQKRGGRDEAIRLNKTSRGKLAKLSMAALTPKVIAAYRDERLAQVAPSTVIRELSYLSSIINHARREWGINMVNPVAMVRKPPAPAGRSRILLPDEELRLMQAMIPEGRRNLWLKPAAIFSLETAMRRGEVLSLQWVNLDLEKQTAFLPLTKNGQARTVPLSRKSVELLRTLPKSTDGRVFPLEPCTLYAAFKKACERADIKGFNWHDLRHTAITRIAEKLPNVIELAAVSGHQSLAMLKRYYHPSVAELAKRLG